jgi:hypothetical protein
MNTDAAGLRTNEPYLEQPVLLFRLPRRKICQRIDYMISASSCELGLLTDDIHTPFNILKCKHTNDVVTGGWYQRAKYCSPSFAYKEL